MKIRCKKCNNYYDDDDNIESSKCPRCGTVKKITLKVFEKFEKNRDKLVNKQIQGDKRWRNILKTSNTNPIESIEPKIQIEPKEEEIEEETEEIKSEEIDNKIESILEELNLKEIEEPSTQETIPIESKAKKLSQLDQLLQNYMKDD